MIKEFNLRFYNDDHYKDGHRHPLLLEKEPNRDNRSPFFKDIIEFCLKTDVCKSLGMSFIELINLDVGSIMEIKDLVLADNERKAQVLNKVTEEQKRQQNALQKTMNANRG